MIKLYYFMGTGYDFNGEMDYSVETETFNTHEEANEFLYNYGLEELKREEI